MRVWGLGELGEGRKVVTADVLRGPHFTDGRVKWKVLLFTYFFLPSASQCAPVFLRYHYLCQFTHLYTYIHIYIYIYIYIGVYNSM